MSYDGVTRTDIRLQIHPDRTDEVSRRVVQSLRDVVDGILVARRFDFGLAGPDRPELVRVAFLTNVFRGTGGDRLDPASDMKAISREASPEWVATNCSTSCCPIVRGACC
ncbi:MAG: hypothetical protein P8Z74_03590 [Acidobacteriota bacterium]